MLIGPRLSEETNTIGCLDKEKGGKWTTFNMKINLFGDNWSLPLPNLELGNANCMPCLPLRG